MEEVDDYEATLNWAQQEEKLRIERGQGFGSFYLVIGSIFIFLFCLLIFYYANKGRKDELSALDMITDPEHIFDDDFSNFEEFDDNFEEVEEIEEEQKE